MNVVLEQLKIGKMEYLEIALMMMDEQRNYYRKHKTSYWSNSHRSANMDLKNQLIEMFIEQDGFILISEWILDDRDLNLSSRSIAVLFNVVVEAYHKGITSEVGYRICCHAMEYLLTTEITELKNQMGQLIEGIKKCILHGIIEYPVVFKVWLKIVSSYILSSSLPQRLCGFDMLNALIAMSKRLISYPDYVVIKNAGEMIVNGTYTLCKEHALNSLQAQAAKYVKIGEEDTITLFQCKMKNGAKWWFLSRADVDQPGTEKDIDYYQQTITEGAEWTPPCRNWEPLKDVPSPSPIIEPSALVEDDTGIDTCIINWVMQHKVLQELFGDRMHREIVSRCSLLVQFLAKHDALSKNDICLFWSSTLDKEESLRTSVYELIVSILQYLNPNKATIVLQEATNRIGTNDDVIDFAECLANGYKAGYLLLNDRIAKEVLEFLWTLRCDTEIMDTTKNWLKLLSNGLKADLGQTVRNKYLINIVQIIQNYQSAPTSNNMLETTKYMNDSTLKFIALKFLLETFEGTAGHCIDEISKTYSLTNLILSELKVFIAVNAKFNSDSGLPGIEHRLNVLLFMIEVSAAIKFGKNDIHQLWSTLESADYRNLLIQFLQAGVQESSNATPIFNSKISLYIFSDLICRQIQFSGMTETAYACFFTYFLHLNCQKHLLETSKVGEISYAQTLNLIGIDDLWKVALEAPTKVADQASKELLAVYDSLENPTDDSVSNFVQHIFARLENVLPSVALHDNTIKHCMKLLCGFVLKAVGDMDISHGCRCGANDIKVNLIVQLMSPQNSQSVPSKITTRQLIANKKQTLESFRHQIALKSGNPSSKMKLLLAGTLLTKEYELLQNMKVCNGSEIRALVFKDNVMLKAQGASRKTSVHPGNMIADSEHYFDILFSLQRSDTGAVVKRAIWQLLESIPTSSTLIKKLSKFESVFPTSSEQTTNSFCFLSCKYPYKSEYVLGIVESLLMPTKSMDIKTNNLWDATFLETGGFQQVVDCFLSSSSTSGSGVSSSLRILNYCLFNAELQRRSGQLQQKIMRDVPCNELLDKLLKLISANYLSSNGTCIQIVLDAMTLIRELFNLWTHDTASSLWAKFTDAVLSVLLTSRSKMIRINWCATLKALCDSESSIAAELLQVLVEAIKLLDDKSFFVDEYFQLISSLLDYPEAKKLFSDTLHAIATKFKTGFALSAEATDNVVYLLLQVLETILSKDAAISVDVARNTLKIIFGRCLFPRFKNEKPFWPLCTTASTRKVAFNVLEKVSVRADANLRLLLDLLEGFVEDTRHYLDGLWEFECASEAKSRGMHVGLKNQGCSCYMNAFLQQIFMEKRLQNGLLAAQLPESKDVIPIDPKRFKDCPAKLVGHRVANQFCNGKYAYGIVTQYDDNAQKHFIRYDEGEQLWLDFKRGRPGHETGKYSVLPVERKGDDATLEVLREIQKTFCYLKDSEMKYYDPRSFVEGCKCLNLEFSVYQQNDASEFCDKLLDRLETGLKKTPQGTKCLQESLGGKLISQKLPKDCGHRYEREEPFIRIELAIRGKQSIDESLSALVTGELMDGDNKVECDNCGVKKAAIRRTCFGTLPNLLVLHLKRFDLDYTTFETVKLNNRCSFPLVLNMKPYTKEGIESEHKGARLSLDDDDYLYELKGVLVHSGVAQGGHYYSFIQDRTSGNWFRFDDEDVTEFDPQNIEAECFGGVQKRNHAFNGTTNSTEVEVYNNALMLFYEKRIPVEFPDDDTVPIQSRECEFVDEVSNENETFIKSSYLLEHLFHDFLRRIMTASRIAMGSKEFVQPSVNCSTRLSKIGITFFVKVLLRTSEKHECGSWLMDLQHRLEQDRQCCTDFLQLVVLEGQDESSILQKFIVSCPDDDARRMFMELIASALLALDRHEACINKARMSLEMEEFANKVQTMLLQCLRSKKLDEAPLKNLLSLMQNASQGSSSIREQFRQNDLPGMLIFLYMGRAATKGLIQRYSMLLPASRLSLIFDVFQSLGRDIVLDLVFEILELHAGSNERSLFVTTRSVGEYHNTINFSLLANWAVKTIFSEHCNPTTMKMESKELKQFFRASGVGVHEAATTGRMIKYILSHFSEVKGSEQLSIDGFTRYCLESAQKDAKAFWKVLECFGYNRQLLREDTTITELSVQSTWEHIRLETKESLLCPTFFDSLLSDSIEFGASRVSRLVYGQHFEIQKCGLLCILESLRSTEVGWNSQPTVHHCTLAISHILSHSTFPSDLLKITLLDSECGILTLSHQQMEASQRSPQYQSPISCYRFIMGTLVLYFKCPIAKKWLDENKKHWQWMHPWLHKYSLLPCLGGNANYRDPEKQQYLTKLSEIFGKVPYIAIVQGAGYSPINGRYTPSEDHPGAFVLRHETNSFVLLSSRLPSSPLRWYICAPFTNSDDNINLNDNYYYMADTSTNDEKPPSTHWKRCVQNPAALDPPPKVTTHPFPARSNIYSNPNDGYFPTKSNII